MPNTPEGKDISSKNATKHGIFSKRIILEDESQDDYDRLIAGWYEQWEPADFQEKKLVDTLIRNDWWHQRAERRLFEAEAAIADRSGVNPQGWTAEDKHLLENMQRYKTTMERAFYRAWRALQGLRKDVMRESEKNKKLQYELDVYKMREEVRKEHEKQPEPEAQPEEKDTQEAEPLSRAEQVFGRKAVKNATAKRGAPITLRPQGKSVPNQASAP